MRSTVGSIRPMQQDGASSKVSVLRTQQFQQETYNTISQIPKHLKQSIIQDGDILVHYQLRTL